MKYLWIGHDSNLELETGRKKIRTEGALQDRVPTEAVRTERGPTERVLAIGVGKRVWVPSERVPRESVPAVWEAQQERAPVVGIVEQERGPIVGIGKQERVSKERVPTESVPAVCVVYQEVVPTGKNTNRKSPSSLCQKTGKTAYKKESQNPNKKSPSSLG